MKLVEVEVRKFKNIVGSSFEVEPDVTCLVGKNGSGKTASLHALHRLLPAEGEVSFDVHSQYPAWLEKQDRLSGKDLDKAQPIRATFTFEDDEVDQIEQRFGPNTLQKERVVLARNYNGNLKRGLPLDEGAFVEHVIERIEWPWGTKTPANEFDTVAELRQYAKDLSEKAEESNNDASSEEGNEAERAELAAQRVKEQLNESLGDYNELFPAVWSVVESKIPRFLYFDEYSRLPYSVDIEHVLTADPSELERSELTARSLLRLGGADDDYLTDPDYERRKRELENISNFLTRDMREYWSQNPELRVEPDITKTTVSAGRNQGKKAVLDELKLRINDERHWRTLPFDEHSSGLRWFFSFLAAFSKYENTDQPLVILLDEPALGLHAKAQADFLRYIEERLAPRCQVVYTTHSPFMVQPGKLERVRLLEDKTSIEDKDPEGVTISADVTSTDQDTLFPLQGALGYDLVQHLFIGPHNLVVEGTSDYTYLTVISDYLESMEEERITLDDRWSVVPVGGASQVPSFVALLGTHLDVTVLVDAQKKGHQRLAHMADQGILQENRILTIGGVLDRSAADIEDLFVEDDYLDLYNRAFGKEVTTGDLQGDDPIVRRLARYEGQDRFDHGVPADELLRHRDQILLDLSDDTLDRFEALFEKINGTLKE